MQLRRNFLLSFPPSLSPSLLSLFLSLLSFSLPLSLLSLSLPPSLSLLSFSPFFIPPPPLFFPLGLQSSTLTDQDTITSLPAISHSDSPPLRRDLTPREQLGRTNLQAESVECKTSKWFLIFILSDYINRNKDIPVM